MPDSPQNSALAAKQITFTVPATLESAENVSQKVMQMARELGRSAAEELHLGSEHFQRFGAYVMERADKKAKVRCTICWTPEAGFQLSLTDAA